MFMFRNRRHAIIKRLWKLKKCSRATSGRHGQEEEETSDQCAREHAAKSLLNRLKESQLKEFVRVIESKGTNDSLCGQCCLVPKGDIRVPRREPIPPHVLIAQVFRWPDLQHCFELKRLPVCSAGRPREMFEDNFSSDLYECCNPYHWSRLYKPVDLPSGLLERLGQSKLSQEKEITGDHLHDDDSNPSTPMSFSVSDYHTGSGTHSSAGCNRWCKLAYWEESTRVGPQFPVSTPHVDVFVDLPRGNGLCLSALFSQNNRPSDSTLKTRMKIGEGLLLSKEDDHRNSSSVWLYNRTEFPIFVSSSTLGQPDPNTTSKVFKVPPDYSIEIFDFSKSRICRRLRDINDKPYDPYSVKISFAKGWGSSYSRRDISRCPCWLEILLWSSSVDEIL